MQINVLQHTPKEGPGAVQAWAEQHHHELYIYHPYQFGVLPNADETDMLVILGGPMSPNDSLRWIIRERQLILTLLDQHKPIFGACFGAQQITKALGYPVTKAPAKEVGWAPVHLQSHLITDLPETLKVLHWHEEMFAIPDDATLLFSSDLVENQGFILNHHVVGLQFHVEPLPTNVREIVINDQAYITGSQLNQDAETILATPVPPENETALFSILDYITEP